MNEAPLDTEKQYPMTNQMIEIFYNKNALEFNEAYNVNCSNNNNTPIVPHRRKPTEIDPQRVKPVETVSRREKSAETVPQREKLVETVPKRVKLVETVPKREKPVETVSQREKQMEPVQTVANNITARLTLNPQTWMNMRTINQSNQDGFLSVFRGFCYTTIRTGVCYRNPCHYNHDFIPHLMLLYNNNETRFFEVIDNLVQRRHTMFLKSFYQDCIRPDTNPICVLKLLKKLYNSNIIRQQIMYGSIKQLIAYGATVNQIVDNLAKIVNNNDTLFVTSVLKILVTCTAPGNSWPMLKPLLTWIDVLSEDVMQHLLIDCITTQKYIQDVYEHVVRKFHIESLTLLSQNLLIQFHRIHRQIPQNVKVQETVASTSVTITSPDPFNEVKIIPYTVQTDNLSPKVWKNVVFDGNNNAQGGNSSVLLQPIDNVPNPYSKLSREIFWKFYLDVHSLEEGLKHKDYRHVKKILDEAQTRHVSPFTNACYNILRSKVEHSQAHLSKLASLAVQDGATATFCKIIIGVTIHILADLAERELWVLALALLKSLDGILREKSSLFKFDAAVTMLFCEIYLANRKPMKAFNLLKQSNILCTYRGKWKVRNNKRDDDIRAQIVTILLDMFCETSPEHALSLFAFIIEDQSSNFYPIDLSRQVNKLVSLLLLTNDHELIISIGKLIDDYNCTLYPITHRALISSLVRINLPLAKQLYQNAVLLGIYPKMQFYPIMYIIVKSDWTGEEMYLAIWVMMQKFLENLGHAIEGVKPNNLSSYLVFEATPLKKQLVNYKRMDEQYEKKRRGSIELMKQVLETEFDPPLFLVKKRKDKLQKINSVSLYRYLQCNQNCM
ncbi:uncharacterized protein LOC143354407 [Halictus rubicundus]|uniref:uncharacterized protein LOC143354407 n=1 Tax=Halictus rubicundus TaxID=77578 RepID=UPI004036F15D